MKLRVKFHLLVPFLCLSLPACGTSDPIGKTVPVKGKVTVDGQPLKQGSVAFWPKDGKGFEADGQIAEDGTYELSTKGKPGAPPGSYKVTVMAQTSTDSTTPLKAKLLVPQKYTAKEKTDLVVDVVESPAAGAYDLNLK